jgi:hypothetical protein
MDRTKYLQLCQLNAVYPKSRKVKFDGDEYYPLKYILSYDKQGQATHTAQIQSVNAGQCHLFVKLSEVEYEETV